MAKYIIEAKCFLNGSVQDPAEEGRPPHIVEVEDSFVPGFHLRPVDEAAKRAFAAYEAKKAGRTTLVDGKPSVDPVERLSVKGLK